MTDSERRIQKKIEEDLAEYFFLLAHELSAQDTGRAARELTPTQRRRLSEAVGRRGGKGHRAPGHGSKPERRAGAKSEREYLEKLYREQQQRKARFGK